MSSKVLILGTSGFLGKHVKSLLEKDSLDFVEIEGKNQVNLEKEDEIQNYLSQNSIEKIINCSAFVGGISYGYKFPVEMLATNTKMIINLYNAASKNEVKHIVNPISNCAYPGHLEVYKEEDFWEGPPHSSVFYYGLSRRNIVAISNSFKQQYSLDTSNVVLSNMYGPRDHFDIDRSHALGALVKKVCDAKLNNKKEITRVFAGSLFQEHGLACEAVKKDAMQEVNSLFDIVLTSNSGFPLDQNLYQSVKGMAAAARVVKPNGTIICASECKDGLPNHGSYASLLKSQKTPSDLLLMIKNNNFVEPDQWQVQIQAQIQENTKIFLKNSYIQDSDVRKAHLEPISDINEAIDFSLNHYGSSSTLCVLPEGPQVIPYLKCSNNL